MQCNFEGKAVRRPERMKSTMRTHKTKEKERQKSTKQLNTFKTHNSMLELNIYRNNNSYSGAYRKWYARVEVKKQMSIHDMALHMAEHNTPFSVGTIEGILRDFVNCTREQCLAGNTVKIDNLAIFKCAVTANGLDLREGAKISAGLGTKPQAGWGADDTQFALKNVRLQATATGDFTKSELSGEATFRWTKAAKQLIEGIVNPAPAAGGEGGNGGGEGNGGN